MTPIYNRGPCACCNPAKPYPIKFRITKIDGYYTGYIDSVYGIHCEYENGYGADVEIIYSDGSTQTAQINEVSYSNSSSGDTVTLSGTVEYDGYRGTGEFSIDGAAFDWTIEQGLEKYFDGDSLYAEVDPILRADNRYDATFNMVKK